MLQRVGDPIEHMRDRPSHGGLVVDRPMASDAEPEFVGKGEDVGHSDKRLARTAAAGSILWQIWRPYSQDCASSKQCDMECVISS